MLTTIYLDRGDQKTLKFNNALCVNTTPHVVGKVYNSSGKPPAKRLTLLRINRLIEPLSISLKSLLRHRLSGSIGDHSSASYNFYTAAEQRRLGQVQY